MGVKVIFVFVWTFFLYLGNFIGFSKRKFLTLNKMTTKQYHRYENNALYFLLTYKENRMWYTLKRKSRHANESVLLFIIVLAVQQTVPTVAGPAQRAATHRALDASLVPRQFVHAQKEAVCNRRLAPRAHLTSSHVLWREKTRATAERPFMLPHHIEGLELDKYIQWKTMFSKLMTIFSLN